MPTHTTNYGREQYNYISNTSEENEFSERVRELVTLGMALEQTNFDEVAKIQNNKHEEWSPDVYEGVNEMVEFYIENHD